MLNSQKPMKKNLSAASIKIVVAKINQTYGKPENAGKALATTPMIEIAAYKNMVGLSGTKNNHAVTPQ